MKDKDLEKTQPILLSEIKEGKKRSDIYDELADELIDITEEEKEAMEQAEEALAEKNIALAESLLAEEQEEREEDAKDEASETEETTEETQDDKNKKTKKNKLKEKWQKLSKKQKILVIVASILVLLIIIGGIVLLVVKANKKKDEPKKEEEKAVVMADNFYYKDGKLYILDEDEKEIGTYECKNKNSNSCYLAYNNYADKLDVPKILGEDGKTKTERVPVYNNDYIFVYDTPDADGMAKRIVLYSLSQKKELETYTDVKAYDDDYVIVADKKDNYGLIKVNDEVTQVIEPSYENLYMIDKADNLVAQKGNSYVVINKNNKVLSKKIETSEELKYYSNKLIVTEELGKYTAYDYNAKMVVESSGFMTTRDAYLFLINENNEMFIIDAEGTKYNEEGIKLYNDNYVTSYIYDKNGKLSSTKQSFKIEVGSDELNILLYTKDFKEDKYNTVNLKEGLNNKKLAYYSYFNGKLYFYDDEEKVNLLGTYTCGSKNKVTGVDGKLSSCHQALAGKNDDVNNVIPIFNKRYVFIDDGATYNLYDLVEGKNKGVYANVGAFSPSLVDNQPFVSGSYDVIAVNKKNKSGMITITADKVTGKYGFNYNSLKRLKDYIVALNASNKYQLIYNESTASVEYNYDIVDYINKGQYVKLMDQSTSKYYVYDANGKKVGKDTYSYVELYDDYYVAILNDKTLKIYDYEGNVISSKDVTIASTNYFGDKPAFKVTSSGNTFVVSILKNGNYEDTTIERISKDTQESEDTKKDEESR